MKARLPKGMGGGPSDMNSIARQAQKMQEQMGALTEELEQTEYSATAGGNAVEAVNRENGGQLHQTATGGRGS